MTHDVDVATNELDEDAEFFHGEVINTRNVFIFQGQTLDELKAAFVDTVADFIEWCRERGKEPERSHSGNFTVSIPPELHRRIATAAARSAKASTPSSWDAGEIAARPNHTAGGSAIGSSQPRMNT